MTVRSENPPSQVALDEGTANEGVPLGLDAKVFGHVKVALRASLGTASLTVEELLSLKAGAVLKLDQMLGEPVALYLNDALVARGEVVAMEDNFAIRLVEVGPP